jgi:hypothetical protein
MNSVGARDPAITGGEAVDRKPEERSAATHRAGRTRLALGGVAAGLLIAAAAYYFTGLQTGTEVAMRPAPDNAPAATLAPPPEAAANPAPSAAPAPTPPPELTSPQQSPPAPQSPGSSATQEPRAAVPANPPPPETSKPPAQSAEAAPTTERLPSGPSPPAAPQSSMRDQPAALPDQAAAAPKNETMLVVMRGPANIRSEPGKRGRVIGTAVKNATVKELSRSGKWIEVETESGTGWIAGSLLAPRSQ